MALPNPIPLISHTPISDRKSCIRERTFALIQLRPDFWDVVGQFVLVLWQLHREKVTGAWTINFSQGAVQNTKMVETKVV